MNRNEVIAKWESLTPRERDAWVAEVVMGYERRQKPGTMPTWWRKGAGTTSVRRYTTDISAAWAVADRFFAYRLEKLANSYGYDVIIWDEYSLSVSVRESTAPMAICLAAIIAKLTVVTS